MPNRPFRFEKSSDKPVLKIAARGQEVLSTPLLNRGSAFTADQRKALGLTGLLPSVVSDIETQTARLREQFDKQPTPIAKHILLNSVHDRNEVLYYHFVVKNLHEVMPIIYDPVIGEAIKKHSHIYRRPRGLYLSIDHPEDIEAAIDALGLGPDDIDLIVASDAEEILGIGDWGVGGIDIAVGKLAVYTAAAGIDPSRVIPVGLDVGTDREALLNDPLYMGARHARVRGEAYDAFIDRYVTAMTKRFPKALLHWEDFGPSNARRLLLKYRDKICTFNDDMQGTGAITLAGVLAGVKATGVPLKDHRIVVFGAGTAGIGFADQVRDAMMGQGLSEAEAKSRIWCLASHGLLAGSMGGHIRDFQVSYARPAEEVADWARDGYDNGISLAETVRRVHPTILIGTSTQPGAFTEEIVREMAAHCERPMIFPLSNPTELHEAKPVDLIHWTDGRALIATGAPFDPVEHKGVTYTIGQANNAMLYPGLGLGTIVVRAFRISDAMFAAAAQAVADLANPTSPGASVLPKVDDLREVSALVGAAVARTAIKDGLARETPVDVEKAVRQAMWQPEYARIEAVQTL